MVFSAQWIYAFTDNHSMLDIISKHFDDNYKQLTQQLRSNYKEVSNKINVSLKMNEKNKEDIIKRFEGEIVSKLEKLFMQEDSKKEEEGLI